MKKVDHNFDFDHKIKENIMKRITNILKRNHHIKIKDD